MSNYNIAVDHALLKLNVIYHYIIKYTYLELGKPGPQTLTFCVTFHNVPCLISACLLCCLRLMFNFFVSLACFLVRDLFSSGCRNNYDMTGEKVFT